MTTPKRVAPQPKAAKTAAGAAPADWRWADPASLQVNPAFERLIPLQSHQEYRALSRSIQDEGCRDPLTVWKGHNVVLDGHTRRDLCIEYGKKVKVREVELPDERAAAGFILELQRQRRNLTREALSYLRGTEYNAVKLRKGTRRPEWRGKGQRGPLPTTASKVAERLAVSERTIKRDGAFAKVIDVIVAEYGDPEVKRRLLGADVKLTHRLARRLYRMTPPERNAAVKRLVEEGELPPQRRAVREPAETAEALVARLRARGAQFALAVLRKMASLLGREVIARASEE